MRMIDTVNDFVDSVNDGRGDALRVLRARRPAARARVRVDRHQAPARRAVRRAWLQTRRGNLLLKPEGGSPVRRRLGTIEILGKKTRRPLQADLRQRARRGTRAR